MIHFKTIKHHFFNNRKIAENYFFMTILQGANLLIGLLLYPYLIRVLGKEVYGTYVFIFSNIQFFVLFIAFGFDVPALKKLSLAPNDSRVKSRTLSEVFTAKMLLFALCAVLLIVFIHFIPFVKYNWLIYSTIFLTSIGDILFPQWYFQALQKMKYVTCINLSLRLLTIPFIFIFIKSPADLFVYTVIASILPFFGGIFTFFYLVFKEKNQIRFVSFFSLKPVLRDALPFFWTSAFGTIKQELLTFLIGTWFSMEKVAVFDLANKIITIPRMITTRINIAIFPELINKITSERIKRVFRYETFIALSIIALVAISGYWAVLVLGGKTMLEAYPVAVLLSITIYFWLIVGCYINFIFVPQNCYYFVTKNQLIALLSFLVLVLPSLFFNNMLLLIAAFILSHLAELIYCNHLTNKHNLL